MKFGEIVSEYVLKTEKDKVRRNSYDDYGLGPRFVFLGGWYDDDMKWCTAWGVPTQAVLDLAAQQMVDGQVGSMEFVYWTADDCIHVWINDRHHIGHRQVGTVEDLPENLAAIVRR